MIHLHANNVHYHDLLNDLFLLSCRLKSLPMLSSDTRISHNVNVNVQTFKMKKKTAKANKQFFYILAKLLSRQASPCPQPPVVANTKSTIIRIGVDLLGASYSCIARFVLADGGLGNRYCSENVSSNETRNATWELTAGDVDPVCVMPGAQSCFLCVNISSANECAKDSTRFTQSKI